MIHLTGWLHSFFARPALWLWSALLLIFLVRLLRYEVVKRRIRGAARVDIDHAPLGRLVRVEGKVSLAPEGALRTPGADIEAVCFESVVEAYKEPKYSGKIDFGGWEERARTREERPFLISDETGRMARVDRVAGTFVLRPLDYHEGTPPGIAVVLEREGVTISPTTKIRWRESLLKAGDAVIAIGRLRAGEPRTFERDVMLTHSDDLLLDAKRAPLLTPIMFAILLFLAQTSSLVVNGCSSETELAGRRNIGRVLAADATNVYWADGARLMKTPRSVPTSVAVLRSAWLVPSDSSAVVATGDARPSAMVVSASTLCWADGHRILRVPVSGGSPVLVASAAGQPDAIAAYAGNVYWTERADDDKHENTGRLVKAPLDGGAAPTTLADHLDEPADLAVDTTSVYFTERGAGAIRRIALEGGNATTLASGRSSPSALAIDATAVYWTEGAKDATGNVAGRIMRISIGGGAPTIIASTNERPSALTVHGGYVYWFVWASPMRAPITGHGGATEIHTSGRTSPSLSSPLVVVADRIYWIDINDRVMSKALDP